MGDNTVLCVVYILTKQGVKTKSPGGIITYEKKNVIHAVYEYIDIPPGRLLTL